MNILAEALEQLSFTQFELQWQTDYCYSITDFVVLCMIHVDMYFDGNKVV